MFIYPTYPEHLIMTFITIITILLNTEHEGSTEIHITRHFSYIICLILNRVNSLPQYGFQGKLRYSGYIKINLKFCLQ